jgi:hypothetical protein
MPGLLVAGDDEEKCALCGAPAVGPCASCRILVCGDCCVLTEGGSRKFAICLRCDRTKGRSLSAAWRSIGLWLVGLLLLLAAAVALLERVSGGR